MHDEIVAALLERIERYWFIDTTEILADLVASRILMTLNCEKQLIGGFWRWPEKEIMVRWDNWFGVSLTFNSNTIKLSDRAKKVIGKAVRKSLELQEQRRKADEYAKNQMLAIDAIAEVAGITPD